MSTLAFVFVEPSYVLEQMGDTLSYELANYTSNAFDVKFNDVDILKSLNQTMTNVDLLKAITDGDLNKQKLTSVENKFQNFTYLGVSTSQGKV